ncbi:MAG: hypothetical protein EHM83_16070, partial [Burkholderiales bacterium]
MSPSPWLSLAALFAAVVALCVALAHAWAVPVPPQPGPAAPLQWPWRPAWPIVRRLAPVLAPWIGARLRERLRDLLARGALDRAIGPEQFVAGQCIAAVAAAGVALLAAAAVDAASSLFAVPAAAPAAALPRIALRDRIVRRRHAILRRLPPD